MFPKTTDQISWYPTDLFLSEYTHNSFKDLEDLDWEFKEEMRSILEEKFRVQKKLMDKGKK